MFQINPAIEVDTAIAVAKNRWKNMSTCERLSYDSLTNFIRKRINRGNYERRNIPHQPLSAFWFYLVEEHLHRDQLVTNHRSLMQTCQEIWKSNETLQQTYATRYLQFITQLRRQNLREVGKKAKYRPARAMENSSKISRKFLNKLTDREEYQANRLNGLKCILQSRRQKLLK